MRIRTLAPALSSLLFAAACGDVESGVGPDAGEGDDEDVTAPYLVSSTPAHEAAGVTADAVISLVFSEPMDPDSVALALATSPFDEAAVTLTWNAAGDTVTIDPGAPLALAEGVGGSPDQYPAILHSIIVGTAATDLAGNPLEEGIEVAFTTQRRMSIEFELIDALSGLVHSSGEVAPLESDLWIGDGSDASYTRGFVTFGIGLLPDHTMSIEHASFSARQLGVDGDPYATLGDLIVEHLVFDQLAPAFAAAGTAAAGTLAADGTAESKSVDVTAAVQEDWEHTLERGGRSQFRLRFELDTDGDPEPDWTAFAYPTFAMSVVYLSR